MACRAASRAGVLLAVVMALAACGGDPAPADPPPPLVKLDTESMEPETPPAPIAAVGALDDLPAVDRGFFSPEGFGALGDARPGDWLAEHAEYGQSVAAWWADRPNLPAPARRTLYLVPIGRLYPDSSPPIETLAAYIEAFFGLPVKMLPQVELREVGARTRTNEYTRNLQAHAADVLAWMKKHVPQDAYALLAVTETDLYPADSWNFVFGQASFKDRVAVQSTARYHPQFHGQATSPLEARRLILRRTLMVVSHELGHAFGISHCTWYACAMNGSNHLEEADRRPLHLCPVDLRKLHRSVGFDVRERYERLGAFYRDIGFDDDAAWIDDQLERGLQAPVSSP